MATEQNNFEDLRKLLALKRYEQPPPRFFNEFSNRVISRIQALESRRSLSLLRWLGLEFAFKPAVVCAMGVIVCALFMAGVVASLNLSGGTAVASELSTTITPERMLASGPAYNPLIKPEDIPGSTAPLSAAPSSPFSQFSSHIQLVSY